MNAEYSVLNPPTSSCSASTRSNGGRFSSAVAEIMKIRNGTTPVATTFQLLRPDCEATIALVLSVPVIRITAPTLRPSDASYDTIWAEARTEPSSGYFDPDDQPASMMP